MIYFSNGGIELNREYENDKQEVRKVSYAGKEALIAEIERVEKIMPQEETGESDDKNAPGGGMGIAQKAAENSHKRIGRGARVDGCEQKHNKIN